MTHTQRISCILASTASLALSGCAPMMSAPPATPFSAEHTRESGLSVNVQTQLMDAQTRADRAGGEQAFTNAQYWFRRHDTVFEGTESGVVISAGMLSFLSGGGYIRHEIKGLPEGVYIGTQIEGGWIWAGGSLPVAVRVSDGVWLTTQPSIRYASFGLVHVPAGISVELGDHYRLDAEGGAHAMGWLPNQTDNPMFHKRVYVYGGLGLSRNW